ncbi:MAG: hypothetical protein A2X66_00275 [Ignavibacteria bacterium GWA2_54_16]|nr:MAG: hypothetical protein A2X66_00275 [Ignavibacteria bacterium GWA2_54_16]
MKIPSVDQVFRDARRSLLRFPLAILDALIGTSAALVLMDHEGPPTPTFLFQVLFAAILGFPLLAGLAFTAEKKKWGSSASLGSQLAGVLLVSIYALSVPPQLNGAPLFHVIQLVLLTVGMVLFAFVGPYVLNNSISGFWHYSKILLMRLIVAYLYGVVLWAGLAVALAALDNLFGVDIPMKRYGELWAFIQGVFTPWFFLAGVPEDLESIDSLTDYPKSLKMFSQYILFPLVLTYFVILYAYIGKILFAWDWPQGWVSKLILGFIATGFVWVMLLDPIRERAENQWIKTTSRWLFLLSIPLVVMLFLAVWRRVSEYGITEGRYLAMALGVWLCIVVPYFIFSKKKNILVIPATLCLASFLVSFGPWSVFAVSEQSQIARLKGLLERNKILVNGAVQSNHDSLSKADTRQISSVLSYLSDFHGFGGIQPWFAESLKRDSQASSPIYRDPSAVASLMGLVYTRVWQNPGGGIIILNADRDHPRQIGGYDRMLRAQRLFKDAVLGAQGGDVRYHMAPGMFVLVFAAKRQGGAFDSLRIDFQPVVEQLVKNYGSAITDKVPPEEMTVSAEDAHLKVKINLWQIRIKKQGEENTPIAYEGDILFMVDKGKGPE